MLNRYYLVIILLNISLINGYPSNNDQQKCSSDCSNNGICVITNSEEQCLCFPESIGERCQFIRERNKNKIISFKNINQLDLRASPCSLVPNLCENGGLCQFQNNTFSCACPDTHYGPRCQTESPCNNNYCKNNGICSLNDTTDEPMCNCNGTGYEGMLCQKALTTTTISPDNTTAHPLCIALKELCGPGTCQMVNDAPKCQCPPTYMGDFCDMKTATQPGSGSTNGPTNGQTNGQTNGPASGSTNGPASGSTNSPASGSTFMPMQSSSPTSGCTGKTCAQNPCQNSRPCYNTGCSYYCYCGNQYAGTNCEYYVG